MTDSNFPTETSSFWRDTANLSNFKTLDSDIHTGIAVVGGGIAGILTAYTLAKEGKQVVLLEGRDMLSGTTGYTTAKLSAQHQLIYDDLINRYGQEHAKLYYQANMEGIAYIKQIADEHHIDCQLEEQDAFVYTQKKDKLDSFKKEAEAYKKLGIQGGFLEDLPINLDIEAAVQMEKQAQFHPVTFLDGVLKVLKDWGVTIYEHSPVTEVNTEKQAENVQLKTKDGQTVTCDQAVLATHYPVLDPDKFYTQMKPEISYALALKTDKEHPDGMYINEDLPKRTFRKMQANGENYLLVGGQNHSIGDDFSELERYKDLHEFATDTFGETVVVDRWSSHDLITKDCVPFVGQVDPDYQQIFTLTGFSKWGLANAAVGSKIIADLILKRDNRYEKIFAPHRSIPDIQITEPQADKTDNHVSQLNLSKDPEDLKVNEATIIEKDDKKIGVYKDQDEKLHSLDITCTHLGCALNWNNGDRTWDCPCHGSRFKATGEVIEGPALKNLATH